jgi:hypothetical protein
VDSSVAVGGAVQSGDLLKKVTEETSKEGGDKKEADGKGEKGPRRTGQLNLRMSNDNKAYAFQPGRKYFDLVFLPDFEEDYVISAEARLGNASADISLGQGWSLQGMAATYDNDEINKRIFSLMDDSQKILTAAARTALGIPSIPGGPQAGTLKPADKVFMGGTPVSVKISLVRVVAPGLYPVLKPKELQNFDTAKAAGIDPKYNERILVPIAPLTNVAFNTYEVMVFEAVPMAGDSPLRMHQVVDVTIGGGGARHSESPQQKMDLSTLEPQVNMFLESSGFKATAKLNLSADGSTILIKLTPTGDQPLSDEDRTTILGSISESLSGTGKLVKLEP